MAHDDDRPWEDLGGVRRDCEPHRGNWVLLLSATALVLAALSCLLLPVLLAFPLGAACWWSAELDLARMRRGEMDPAGRKLTEHAGVCARLAVFVSLGSCALGPRLGCFISC